MERSLEIVELLIAIGRLPEDRRIRTGKWYLSQKEHWTGWLFHYNSRGAYGRKVIAGRDARFVYNHIVCPEMLAYLVQASGVSRSLALASKRIAASGGSEMERAGKIRKVVPWAMVQDALIANGHARFVA